MIPSVMDINFLKYSRRVLRLLEDREISLMKI